MPQGIKEKVHFNVDAEGFSAIHAEYAGETSIAEFRRWVNAHFFELLNRTKLREFAKNYAKEKREQEAAALLARYKELTGEDLDGGDESPDAEEL